MEYRAFALQRLGRADAARAAYRALLSASPDHAWALTRLGHLLGVLGEHAEAEAMLRRAVRLDPSSHDTRRRLALVQRSRRDYAGADATIRLALRSGDEAGWCFAQLAYLHWAQHEPSAARGALETARKAGGSAEDVARVDRLLRWESEARDASATEPSFGPGPWRFEIGHVVVMSGLGPRLPPDVRKLVEELPDRYRSWLGTQSPRSPVVVHMYRTLEDHEEARLARFPAGSPGRAFLEQDAGGRSGGGRGRPGRGGCAIHVPWPADALPTSLSHELAHAAIHDAMPWLPLWLDEGLATYFEVPPAGGEMRGSRPDLESVVRSAQGARRLLPWERLFRAERLDFEGVEGRARYAQAWSVVRFLLEHGAAHGTDEKRRERLEGLVAALAGSRRDDPAKAIETACGREVAELERAWTAAARRGE
jgi:hypothetical protein